MKYLNLGCGNRFFENWTNVDFVGSHSSVITHNLLNGIPFPDSTFDVVYHSHVLEHFPKDKAFQFLKECFRVLKKGGIIRVVVPDLEQIVRLYIQSLSEVKASETEISKANYDWSLIELFDQVVRSRAGGEMVKVWNQDEIVNLSMIEGRMGSEFLSHRNRLKENMSGNSFKGKSYTFQKFLKWDLYRDRLLKIISGDENIIEYYRLGRFRFSGEVHQWMYDSYSLGSLLTKVGFEKIAILDAYSSNIHDWIDYISLDVENGKIRKPDSLFIEALK